MYTYMSEHVPYETFEYRICKDRHNRRLEDNEFGTVPYWQNRTFYDKITEHARRRLQWVWPFDDFSTAGVKYKLKKINVKYEAYTKNAEDRFDEWVDDSLTTDRYKQLQEPAHVLVTDEMNKGLYYPKTFSGRFVIRFRVICDAEKARDQRISYADDALTKRIKMILNDRKTCGPSNDLHTIGALFIALATWHTEERKDERDRQMPPYPKVTLQQAMGDTTSKEYKKALELCRLKEKEKVAVQGLLEIGRQSPTSSTHGPQEDAQHSRAGHSGTPKTSPKSTKDTNKKTTRKSKSPVKVSTGTLSLRKPAVKERFWERSTRVWKPDPIPYSHTAKVRPRSRERERSRERPGGRSSSELARKSVFDRLYSHEKQRCKSNEEDVEIKKSRYSQSRRD